MAQTSLASLSKRRLALCGCGIDAERISRFFGILERDVHPFPFVFTAQEIVHARASEQPPMFLCASWCCKEALFKAMRSPYNWNGCEFLWNAERQSQPLDLPSELRNEVGFSHALASIALSANEVGVIIACVYLFAPSRP